MPGGGKPANRTSGAKLEAGCNYLANHCRGGAHFDEPPRTGTRFGAAPYQPAPSAERGKLAGARTITIQYVNHQGQSKVFTADADSGVRQKNHITLRVAPGGRRIELARDRIQNLSEVEAAFPQRVAPGQDWPTPRERQILSYHKKYATTSARFEEIRLNYPNW